MLIKFCAIQSLAILKQRFRKSGLPDNTQKRSFSDRIVEWNGYRDSSLRRMPLEHAKASIVAHDLETVVLQYGRHLLAGKHPKLTQQGPQPE